MTTSRAVATLVAVAMLAAGACTSGDATSPSTTTTSVHPLAAEHPDVPPPPAPPPIAVGLQRAGPPVDPNRGDTVPIGGFSLSEAPTVRVELWDGADLVSALDVDDPATELEAAWEWTPDTAGIHALVVRGFDADGRSATSFPLWLRVREADRSAIQAMRSAVAAPADDPSTGALASTDCDSSITVPPQDGHEGIAVYAAPFGAPGFLPVDLLPATGGTTTFPFVTVPLLVYTEAYVGATTVQSAPQLVLPPNPCVDAGWSGLHLDQGILSVPGAAEAAYLYVSYDGGEVWDRVPAFDQRFVAPDPDGRFDFSGHLDTARPALMFEAWGLVGGHPRPLGTGSFVAPVLPSGQSEGAGGLGPGVAFAGPNVAQSSLDWVLADDVLVRHGTFCTYPPQVPVGAPPSPVPVEVVGATPAATTTTSPGNQPIAVLPDHCANAPFGGYSTTFRWSSSLPGATHGLLQVGTQPPPPGGALSYPGLMLTKAVPPGGGASGDFEVDVAKVVSESKQALTADPPPGIGYAAALNLAGLGQPPIETPTLPLVGAPGTPSLYLRVLPMSGPQPLPGASNTVVVDFDDTPPAPPANEAASPAISLAVTMVPPRLPNPAYERCGRVMSNPFPFGANPVPTETPGWYEARGEVPPLVPAYPAPTYTTTRNSAYSLSNGVKVHAGLVPGATVCAWQPTPSAKTPWEYIEDAIEFVSWVWDMYAFTFQFFKAKIVTALATLSGCKPAATGAGASDGDAAAACEYLSTMAVNAGLAVIGIPPTMPKFSELVAAAKEDLATLVVEAGAQSGILDCGEMLQSTCEEIAQKLVEKFIDETGVQLANALVKTATSGQNWVLAVHPGIALIPEPSGVLSPATFEIEITRSSDPAAPPPPAVCTYTAQVSGKKQSYQWHDHHHEVEVVGPLATGAVMVPAAVQVDLSGLAPGGSTTTVIVLDQIVAWYLPGQHPTLPGVPSWVKPSTWVFMAFDDATLTTQLTGSPGCGSAFQDHAQNSLPTTPDEIAAP